MQRAPDAPVRIAFVDVEERQALRVFLRALRRLDLDLPWEATVVSAQGPSSSTPLRAELRERVRFTTDGEDEAVACADILVAASAGARPAPALVMRAIAAGAIPVALAAAGLRGARRRGRACSSSRPTPRCSPASCAG